YSFDGGVIYEYTKEVESERSITIDWEASLSTEFAVAAGFIVGGSGLSNETSYAMTTTLGGSRGSSSTTVNTVSYHLEDNDPNDNFTVDVLDDKTFGVPVFRLKSGQSSCPHEPGTQHHDQVAIKVAEAVQVNVPETEAAVFELTLSNLSPSGQARTYLLGLEHPSNPDGAVVKVNGQPVNDISYTIDAGQSIPVTLTVERGPEAYNYEDLEIYLFAPCETDRADLMGIEPDSLFEQGISISAYFIESCSDVNISAPGEGWVIDPSFNDRMSINLNGYDLDHSQLEMVRVQYRPSNGNGAWINVAEVPKDSLGELYEVVVWDVSALSDGPFELRAVTQCSGGLPSGISDIVSGRLEREPPALLGSPSPSNGILHAADQIYIEFTEDIDCSKLTSLPSAIEDFVGLFDVSTGQQIDIDISCLGNKIVLTPNIQNKFIEN
ncbi:MAG: hypothetical protein AAFP02_17270, partial [Bacteroidota bacterium]